MAARREGLFDGTRLLDDVELCRREPIETEVATNPVEVRQKTAFPR